jgi:small ligand-binding sensory domain FIST
VVLCHLALGQTARLAYIDGVTESHSGFAVSAHWSGKFDEAGLSAWAGGLRARLDAPTVSLGLVFMAPRFFPQAATVLELLRVHARLPLLMGCSGHGLICGAQELEEQPGVVLGLYHLPGAKLAAQHFTAEQAAEANGPAYWHAESGVDPEETNGWLVFADPFQMECERWVRGWSEAYAPLPVYGGLASGSLHQPGSQLYLNGEVFDEGSVALSVGGQVRLDGIVSQGCTPIGDTWTITRTERNVIFQIANRRAYEVLAETYGGLSAEEQRQAQGNLLIGLAANEYLEEFPRGDFLVRPLVAVDPGSGALAVGAAPRIGQTIQFQRRDAATASEDLRQLLRRKSKEVTGQTVLGGVLCTCNGRGRHFFSQPSHDAQHVSAAFGGLGLAGFFCNGEIGPVGERSFLHGFTASLALFVRQPASP